jgi:hypothetical protein
LCACDQTRCTHRYSRPAQMSARRGRHHGNRTINWTTALLRRNTLDVSRNKLHTLTPSSLFRISRSLCSGVFWRTQSTIRMGVPIVGCSALARAIRVSIDLLPMVFPKTERKRVAPMAYGHFV